MPEMLSLVCGALLLCVHVSVGCRNAKEDQDSERCCWAASHACHGRLGRSPRKVSNSTKLARRGDVNLIRFSERRDKGSIAAEAVSCMRGR